MAKRRHGAIDESFTLRPAGNRQRGGGSESLSSCGSLKAYPQCHVSSNKNTSPDHSPKQMYSLVTQRSNIWANKGHSHSNCHRYETYTYNCKEDFKITNRYLEKLYDPTNQKENTLSAMIESHCTPAWLASCKRTRDALFLCGRTNWGDSGDLFDCPWPLAWVLTCVLGFLNLI